MYRWLMLTILLLLTAVVPALAQDVWFAYVYNGVTKSLVRVDLNGTTTSYDLSLDENTFVGGADMTFTPDGQRVIFCAITTGQQTQGRATLYVRDIVTETTITQVDLGPTLGCRTGKHALSPDNQTVAVGMVNYFPGNDAADTSMPIWQLVVVDINNGTIMRELSADMPAASALRTTEAIIPWVQRYTDGQVIFAEVPYAIGGVAYFPPYAWDVMAGTVSDAPAHFGEMALKHLPGTATYIWPDVDESRPYAEPIGPMPVANVVQMLDESGERPIYYTGTGVIVDVAFINAGRQIAILQEPAAPTDAMSSMALPWFVLDREGNITELATVQSFSQIADAPGGYILLRMEADENFENIQFSLEHSVIGGETSLLWLTEGQSWELAWAQPVPPATDLPAFPTAS